MLSLLTPAFNEAENLPALHARIVATMSELGVDWEWVIVDDHSRDETFRVVEGLAATDARVRGLRLARNSGSHTAIACGLHHVVGDAAVMMAADLQDPPETLGTMIARWRDGAQVVWAVRRSRPDGGTATGFAALYYWIMRRLVGMAEMPRQGADFFLIDATVIRAFREFRERNTSVLALITWMGFRQAFVDYDKQERRAGRSGWTLQKKIKLVIDSVTSFSEFPIRWCSYAGAGLLASALLLLAAVVGGVLPVSGGVGAVLVVLVGLTGVQLVALGVVGEYVWRALDEARRRPLYVVEAAVGREPVKVQ